MVSIILRLVNFLFFLHSFNVKNEISNINLHVISSKYNTYTLLLEKLTLLRHDDTT